MLEKYCFPPSEVWCNLHHKITMNFGELIKNLRIGKQLTLRQCSAALGVDPSNWSKMERGVSPPPKDIDILDIAIVVLMSLTVFSCHTLSVTVNYCHHFAKFVAGNKKSDLGNK